MTETENKKVRRDSDKAANQRWQTKNYKNLTCKIYREDAAEFEEYCRKNGMTPNECIKKFVSECIGRPLTRRTAKEES